MDFELLLSILVAALLLALLWQSVRQGSEQARIIEALARCDAQIQGQSRQDAALAALIDGQARTSEDLLRGLDKSLRAGQLATLQSLERRLRELQSTQASALADARTQTVQALWALREALQKGLGQYQTRFEQRQTHALKLLQDSLHSGIQGVHSQVGEALSRGCRVPGSCD